MTNKKGFTLIELLIVIAIIGILAAALIPNILNAPAAARDTGRIAAINDIVTAMEQYLGTSNGTVPASFCTSSTLPVGFAAYFKGSAAPITTTNVAGCNGGYQVCNLTGSTAYSGFKYMVLAGMEKAGTDGSKYFTTASTCPTNTALTKASATTTGSIYYVMQ